MQRCHVSNHHSHDNTIKQTHTKDQRLMSQSTAYIRKRLSSLYIDVDRLQRLHSILRYSCTDSNKRPKYRPTITKHQQLLRGFFYARSKNCGNKLFASCIYLSPRPCAWNNSSPTGRIFMKFGICVFFENISVKFKFREDTTITTGISHEDLCTFMKISRSVLLRMRNVAERNCRENKNTHFVFDKFFF